MWCVVDETLVTRAGSTGIRNVAYFGAAQAGMWLTVLVVYAVVGIAALVALSRRSA